MWKLYFAKESPKAIIDDSMYPLVACLLNPFLEIGSITLGKGENKVPLTVASMTVQKVFLFKRRPIPL